MRDRRTLTGAWIETQRVQVCSLKLGRRTLKGAWIETTGAWPAPWRPPGRPLTSAWIEIRTARKDASMILVASSAVRGLKKGVELPLLATRMSYPHGCVD